jgi:arylsulfatase A-like enzyme
MQRRDFLKTLGFGAVAITIPGCQDTLPRPRKPSTGKPNIIFILADDLGYGDLGCYGQKNIQTPHIDRIAKEGVKFTDHYAGSTVCAPSRCVLMTGLHTGHSYVRGNREVKPMGQIPLPADTVTVAKLMKQAGYTTGLIGKWGLGPPDSIGHPNKQGFDYFFGYLCQRHAHNYYPEFLFRNDEKVPLQNKIEKPRPDGAGVAVEKNEYSHDLCAAEALQFVEKNRNQPFFLCLTLTIPHANNEAGRKGMEVPDYGIYKTKDWPEPQIGHAAMISRMDSDIGRLMARLKKLNLDDNTLVMFSSDNGPHREGGNDPDFNDSNGPLRGIKRDLYEGGIRVPLLACWPGKIPASTMTAHISAFWDFLPTCCDVAGIQSPSDIDGISFLPTLLGQTENQKKHEYMYWEFNRGGSLQAVRMGDWKLIRFVAQNKFELYNLKTDIGEQNNVADQHPEIVAQIENYLKTARTESEYWPLHKKKPPKPTSKTP